MNDHDAAIAQDLNYHRAQGDTVIDTPEGIEMARLLAIKGRLNLEMKGIKFKGRGITTIVNDTCEPPERLRTKVECLEYVNETLAYMAQAQYVRANFGDEADKHANYGWAVDPPLISSKIYGYGILTTDWETLEHEFAPFGTDVANPSDEK